MFVLDLNKIHSYVDIITNSSTVIYTWSEGSVDKAKDLLRAMFDLFGEKDVDIDEEFTFGIFPDDFGVSREKLEKEGFEFTVQEPEPLWGDENKDAREKYFAETSSVLDKLKISFLKNSDKTPDWYKEMVKESLEDTGWSGYRDDNTLVIVPKDRKYQEIIEKMISFLYSTSHDGVYDG